MKQRFLASTLNLRDGVEVFIYPPCEGKCQVLFLFLGTRRRLKIVCRPQFAVLLKEIAKDQSLETSLALAHLDLDDSTAAFLNFLEGEGIVAFGNPIATDLLPAAYVEQYKRQMYFLLDVLKQPELAIAAQKRIFDACIVVLGLGAVGSNILQQLCMVGFRHFTIADYAVVEKNDVARTPYAVRREMGKPKTLAAKKLIDDLAFKPEVQAHDLVLTTQTKIEPLLQNASLIINTADEPYVGYTNIRLSRYALQHNVPMVAAGGFDAHLASLGELLIPHVTPCADCYATFFHENLKNWKPVTHPVQERSEWFGGLGSLSAFSAATAVLEVLSYFIHPDTACAAASGGRGEFLFHDYSLDTFSVERDIHCPSCGEEEQ